MCARAAGEKAGTEQKKRERGKEETERIGRVVCVLSDPSLPETGC